MLNFLLFFQQYPLKINIKLKNNQNVYFLNGM